MFNLLFFAVALLATQLFFPGTVRASTDTFPKDNTHRVQITYTVKNASLGKPVDSSNFSSIYRTYEGRLGTDTLQVFGNIRIRRAVASTDVIRVTVTVGDEVDEQLFEIPFDYEPEKREQVINFSVSVPIPRDADSGGFHIKHAAHGPRKNIDADVVPLYGETVVSGNLSKSGTAASPKNDGSSPVAGLVILGSIGAVLVILAGGTIILIKVLGSGASKAATAGIPGTPKAGHIPGEQPPPKTTAEQRYDFGDGREYAEGRSYTFNDGVEYTVNNGEFVPGRGLQEGERYLDPDGNEKIWIGGQSWHESDWRRQDASNQEYRQAHQDDWERELERRQREIAQMMREAAQQGGPDENSQTVFEGGDGPGDCGRAGLPNYWVNTSTLNLVIEDTIFGWLGLGPSVDLTLTYNSGGAGKKGMFGPGWFFRYDWHLVRSGSTVTVFKGSGQEETFSFSGADEDANLPVEMAPVSGCYNRLLYMGDCWLYFLKNSRQIHRFDKVPGTEYARLTRISDYNGNMLEIGFDTGGHIGSITDAAKRTAVFGYNQAGLCASCTLPDGSAASFEYTSDGVLTRVVDFQGIATEYGYDHECFLTRMVVGREQKTTCFSYGTTGTIKHLGSVTNAGEHTTSYEMAVSDKVRVKSTCPRGKTTVYTSMGAQTETVMDPAGNYVEYTYRDGLPVAYRNKNGQMAEREYDQRGNLVGEKDFGGNSTRYQYDSFSNLVKIINPLGAAWSFSYDDRHNLLKIVSPLGAVTTREYDSLGQLTAVMDARGGRTSLGYDRCGNLETITDPLENSIAFGYDDLGMFMTSATDPLGNTTSYEYDRNGRLIGVRHPDGSARSYVYDCCAGILTTDENGNSAGYERDPLLNITRSIDRLSNFRDYRYDSNSNLVEVVGAGGQKTVMTYDDAGMLSEMVNAPGNKTVFTYDPAGNLVALEDPLKRKTLFSRDPSGMSGHITDHLGNEVSMHKDAAGQVREITNARKTRIAYDYDTSGRMKAKRHDNAEVATCSHDASGNLVEMKDIRGTTSYTYDAADRLVSIGYPDGLAIDYVYDGAGNLSGVSYPGGIKVEYGFDNRNRVTEMRWGENRVFFAYDPVGNLLSEKRSNGVDSRYSYDACGRLESLEHSSDGEPFCRIMYTRNSVGNVVEETGLFPHDLWEFGKQARTDGSLESPCTYDPDGNLAGIEGGIWQAAYDPENRLEKVTRNGRSTWYLYDGLGYRYQAGTDGSTRKFYCDPDGKVLMETGTDGTACFIYRGDLLVAAVNAGQETTFYHFDRIGSTLALTDEQGAITAAYNYSPFGEVSSRGTASGNPFTYVGAHGVMDDGDGLYLMKNRYYNACTGKFVQKDPIGIRGGINLYAYAENNPVNKIDPHGLFGYELADPLTWGGIIVSGVGGILVAKGTFMTGGLVLVAAGGAISVYSSYKTWSSRPKDLPDTKINLALQQQYIIRENDGSLRIDEEFVRDVDLKRGGRWGNVEDVLEEYKKLVEEYNRTRCGKP